MLGRAYIIQGEYASVEYIRRRLIYIGLEESEEPVDFYVHRYDNDAAYSYKYPETCEVLDSTPSTSTVEFTSESYKEYSSELQSALNAKGIYGAYSGTIDMQFESEDQLSTSRYYKSIFETASAALVQIVDGCKILRPEAQADLDNPEVTPLDLFREWGTHLVTAVIIGGQFRYSAFAEKKDFSSRRRFDAAVEGAYYTYSGSGRVSSSVNTSESHKVQRGDTNILGGTTSGRESADPNEGWAVWAASIPEVPSVISFPDGGVVPIWDFCRDEDVERKKELSEAFKNLSKPNLKGGNQYIEDQNDRSDDYLEYKERHDEFLVGFAGNVNGEGKLNRMAVMVENVYTGNRSGWRTTTGRPFRSSDYEVIATVPEGFAMTGLAVQARDNKLHKVKLCYQFVKPGQKSGTTALDPNVKTLLKGGDKDRDWDLKLQPEFGNELVWVSLKIKIKNNRGKILVGKARKLQSDLPIYN